jgi:hypothetical protein
MAFAVLKADIGHRGEKVMVLRLNGDPDMDSQLGAPLKM